MRLWFEEKLPQKLRFPEINRKAGEKNREQLLLAQWLEKFLL